MNNINYSFIVSTYFASAVPVSPLFALIFFDLFENFDKNLFITLPARSPDRFAHKSENINIKHKSSYDVAYNERQTFF